MRVAEVTLSNYQIKQLFEEFNSKLSTDGESAKYSWFLFKNSEAMAGAYAQLMNELFDERREPDFPAMYQEQQALLAQFMAIPENVVERDGNKTLTPAAAAKFDEEFKPIREKYSELFDKIEHKAATNQEIFNKQIRIQATILDLSEFPANTKPFIVGLLGS